MFIERETIPPIYHVDLSSGLQGKYARVVERLPDSATVLELGCSSGYFGSVLMRRGYQVAGVEGDPNAAALAEAAGLKVVCGDLENPAVFETLDEKFDVVLLMDVLEHLREPELLLSRARSLLKPTGVLLVTGPNVAYWRVRLAILMGEWRYTETGIMDRTHLRFFTREGWEALIQETGYELSYVEAAEGMLPLEHQLKHVVPGFQWLHRRLIEAFPEWFAIVFLFEARLQHA